MREKSALRNVLESVGVIVGLIVLIIALGSLNMEDEVYEYKPMVYVNDTLYGESGEVQDALSEEWELVGSVETLVSNTEPMVKENYTSNFYPVGTEIYGNKDDDSSIYVYVKNDEYPDGKYVLLIK